MTIVQSWKESLTLLRPKNAQLFLMVTVKSIVEAYKILFYYWWWAVLLLIAVGCSGVYVVIGYGASQYGILFTIISLLLYQLLLFAACLATRPSIMQKNCMYFRSYSSSFIYTIIILFFIPQIFWPTMISSLYIFLLLFFFDSSRGPRNFLFSVWNALKMVIYNLPLLIVTSIIFRVLGWLSFTIVLRPVFGMFLENSSEQSLLYGGWYSLLIYNFLMALLLPIGVCMYANIYIKKLHDQFDLYFQQP